MIDQSALGPRDHVTAPGDHLPLAAPRHRTTSSLPHLMPVSTVRVRLKHPASPTSSALYFVRVLGKRYVLLPRLRGKADGQLGPYCRPTLYESVAAMAGFLYTTVPMLVPSLCTGLVRPTPILTVLPSLPAPAVIGRVIYPCILAAPSTIPCVLVGSPSPSLLQPSHPFRERPEPHECSPRSRQSYLYYNLTFARTSRLMHLSAILDFFLSALILVVDHYCPPSGLCEGS